MKPVLDSNEVILNAAVLSADRLIHRRVLCPGCGTKVFERWPDGWDAHAASRCAGLEADDETTRKAEFKATFRTLFRP